MTYDPKAPPALLETQEWFANIITRPIDRESRMNPISPSGNLMSDEAQHYIAPSLTLEPWQRIQIYNQQYWWRLLSVLQESFPFATRLFGYEDFNQRIGIPYLDAFPPYHWSLNKLGEGLPGWVKESYHDSDKLLVREVVEIDWAFSDSFCAIEYPPLLHSSLEEGEKAEALLEKKLYLQPHLHLFELNADLFTLRKEFLSEDPEYWETHDFPEIISDRKYYFVLYRNSSNDICWKEVSSGEFYLLKRIRTGSTVEEACCWIEDRNDGLFEEASQTLHLWFQEWTARQWLTLRSPTFSSEKG